MPVSYSLGLDNPVKWKWRVVEVRKRNANGTNLRQDLQAGSRPFSENNWEIPPPSRLPPGVGMSTLSRWWSEMQEHGEQAFVGSGNLQPEAEELKRLLTSRK
jgi:hypothetical protein